MQLLLAIPAIIAMGFAMFVIKAILLYIKTIMLILSIAGVGVLVIKIMLTSAYNAIADPTSPY